MVYKCYRDRLSLERWPGSHQGQALLHCTSLNQSHLVQKGAEEVEDLPLSCLATGQAGEDVGRGSPS